MKLKILYTSADIRKAVIDIFRESRGRRIAITAFVGRGAEAFLPKPEGIELICWPKAGGTNPNAIRQLMKRGVKVFFADRLHMKLYWTEDKGCILTSANLSTNALGSGDLREIGVYLPSYQVKIDRILRTIERQPVSYKKLLTLDKAHHEYTTRNWETQARQHIMSFSEWYTLPNRPPWKIGYWNANSDFSSTTKKISKKEYGVDSPYDFISCAPNTYKKTDWVLTFYLKKRSPSLATWLPVDYISRTPKSDKAYERDYPYQAVQLWPMSHYTPPPFRVDRRFQRALSIAIQEIGADKIRENDYTKTPQHLIKLLWDNF